MRKLLITIPLFFVLTLFGCDDDTSSMNPAGGRQATNTAGDRRDAGRSLANNVSFDGSCVNKSQGDSCSLMVNGMPVDAACQTPQDSDELACTPIGSLTDMGMMQPMGGDSSSGAGGNMGANPGSGGQQGGNNTATRVDMGMPNIPEICTDLPELPDAPMLDPNVRCARDNQPKRVQDIRSPACRMNRPDDEDVVIDEAIVTAIFPPKPGRARQWEFAVQDREGGAYSGIWIYLTGTDFDRNLREGDVLRIEGQRKEFYELTEIIIASGDGGYQRVGQADVPRPFVVRDPTAIASGEGVPTGRLTEMLESVLVEVRNVRVTNTAPDCPVDYDMFAVDGNLRIEDEVGLDYQAALGDVIERVTGILHHSFETHKIIPRSNRDLDTTHCGGLPNKCELLDCRVEEGAEETGELVITEIQDDPRGLDAEREYVELYNPGDTEIDLNGWWLQNCGPKKSELEGRIAPGGYFVVARSNNAEVNGGVSADDVLDEGVHLGNGQGALLLFNANRALVDQVRYESIPPWPMRQPGQSLELGQLDRDNSNGAFWSAGRNDYGPGGKGTPGRGPQR